MVIPTQESPYPFNRDLRLPLKNQGPRPIWHMSKLWSFRTLKKYGDPFGGFFVQGSTGEGYVGYVANTFIKFLRRRQVSIINPRFLFCSETRLRTSLETKLQRHWESCLMGDASYLCWILQNSWLASKNMYNDNRFWERSQINIK